MLGKIPDPIRVAAAQLLEPYGVALDELMLLSGTERKAGAKFMNLEDVKKTYGLGRWLVSRLIKRGKIAAAKMSPARAGKVLVDTESLERFLADSKINNNGGTNER